MLPLKPTLSTLNNLDQTDFHPEYLTAVQWLEFTAWGLFSETDANKSRLFKKTERTAKSHLLPVYCIHVSSVIQKAICFEIRVRKKLCNLRKHFLLHCEQKHRHAYIYICIATSYTTCRFSDWGDDRFKMGEWSTLGNFNKQFSEGQSLVYWTSLKWWKIQKLGQRWNFYWCVTLGNFLKEKNCHTIVH